MEELAQIDKSNTIVEEMKVLRDKIKNHIGFEIVKSIKEGYSPLLNDATKEELEKNTAYNGMSGFAYDGLNMILIDTKVAEYNKWAKDRNNKYVPDLSDIWLDAKQASMLGVEDFSPLTEKQKEFIKEGIIDEYPPSPAVQLHRIKKFDYEPQYQLDKDGNKIPVLDENGTHIIKNDKPLFYRARDEQGKYLPNKKVELETPVIETYMAYNLSFVKERTTLSQEEFAKRFDMFIKPLASKAISRNAFKEGVDISDKNIRLEELVNTKVKGKDGKEYQILNENTAKKINSYYGVKSGRFDKYYGINHNFEQQKMIKEQLNDLKNAKTAIIKQQDDLAQKLQITDSHIKDLEQKLKIGEKNPLDNPIVKATFEAIKKEQMAKTKGKEKAKAKTQTKAKTKSKDSSLER